MKDNQAKEVNAPLTQVMDPLLSIHVFNVLNLKGQVYEYDKELGQRYICPLCKNIGYTMKDIQNAGNVKVTNIYPF